MLVLTRKPGEALVIGDEVELSILEVRGDMVRIGIKAPPEVKIWRHEVLESIRQANRAAALTTDTAQVKGLLESIKTKGGGGEKGSK